MKTKLMAVAFLFVILSITIVDINIAFAGGGCGGGGGKGGCGGGGGGSSIVPLSEFEKQALTRAIDEERMAKAIYEKVVETFGPISPFPWIIKDEQCHINRVARLLTKYGLPIPPDRWAGNVALEFTSKQQACEVGAQAEFDNAAFYDTMIPQVSHDDIASAFSMLRDVSRYKHLPDFQNWAAIYASLGE